VGLAAKHSFGGQYIKVLEPDGFSEKTAKQISKKSVSTSAAGKSDILNFLPFLVLVLKFY
jgi:hypothetical protein